MDLLSAFVCVQRFPVERARHLARCRFPLPDLSEQIAAQNPLAAGMKNDAVNIQLVSRHFAHLRTIARIPDPHESIVSAACEQRAIGTEGDRTNPSVMRLDFI